MSDLAPLAMSQAKDELLRHMQMSQETYSLMAKETDRVYKWLASDKRHLKNNCKRKAPYDWSDILENSKDEAMRRIASSGTPHTAYYWDQATETPECPNWISRWFLYHKFRYRDGRNRNPVKMDEGKHRHSSKHHHSYDKEGSSRNEHEHYYTGSDVASSSAVASHQYTKTGSNAMSSSYATNDDEQECSEEQAANEYYDPVRDATRPT